MEIRVTAMLEGSGFVHPGLVATSYNNTWCDPFSVSAHLHRPVTVPAGIRFLRDLFRAIDDCFDLQIPFVQGLSLVPFGVHPPQAGISIFMSASTIRQGELLLQSFTLQRPIRTTHGLARPL